MPRSRPTRAAIASVLAASVLALPIITSGGASGDPIGDKRAEAARIASKLDELQSEAEVYAEQYNNAVITLDHVRGKVAAQQVRVNATQKRVKSARKAIAAYAVSAYTSSDNQSDGLSALLSTGRDTASQRSGYISAVMGDRQDALDRLNAATSDNDYQLKRLGKAKADAAKARADVASKKDATESAVAEQTKLKRRVEGELARLVAQEQARRRAIAIRKAKEAAARAQAAEAARERARERAQQAADAAAQRRAAAAAAATSTSRAAASSSSSSTSSTAASRPRVAAPAPAPAPPPPPPAPAPTPAPAPPSSGGASAAVAAARSVLGVPYQWAGASPSGFDCSGLVMWAWAHGGKSLPHSSSAQYAMSRKISVSQLQPGDIVAFYSPVSHIGLYIGGGMMIHAPHTGDVVKISSIYADGTPKAGRL